MGLKKLGVLFLLVSVQLHPLLALSHTSLPDPFMATDLDQESVPKGLTKLDKHNITAVNKHGGIGGGGHAGGGGRGSAGRAKGRGGGNGSPGDVVPLYPAGGTNHPGTSHSHRPNGTLLGLLYFFLIFVAFCFILFVIFYNCKT